MCEGSHDAQGCKEGGGGKEGRVGGMKEETGQGRRGMRGGQFLGEKDREKIKTKKEEEKKSGGSDVGTQGKIKEERKRENTEKREEQRCARGEGGI